MNFLMVDSLSLKNMAKRWSKLKKKIEDLFFSGLTLVPYIALLFEQLHIMIMRVLLRQSWAFCLIRLAKEIVWTFPRQFVDEPTIYSDGGNAYFFETRDLKALLRDHIDTPKDAWLKN